MALWLLCMTAVAQGSWTVSHRDADELKGQDARDVYLYEAPGVGTVVVWDWDKADFRLITDNGFFKAYYYQGSKYYPITVGFYDDDGKLEKKFGLDLIEEYNHGGKYIATGGFYYGGRGNIRKLLSRMKSGKGYVRILADLYNRSAFDIMITPFEKQ